MSGTRTQNFQWLASHINGASSEIANWPTWKSQSSTRADCNSIDSQPVGKGDSAPETSKDLASPKRE
jgi:hypothetical protein